MINPNFVGLLVSAAVCGYKIFEYKERYRNLEQF